MVGPNALSAKGNAEREVSCFTTYWTDVSRHSGHPRSAGVSTMALGRYVVDAVLLEGRSPTELARTHGISRSRIYQLIARFREGGYPALEPRSRRSRSCS